MISTCRTILKSKVLRLHLSTRGQRGIRLRPHLDSGPWLAASFYNLNDASLHSVLQECLDSRTDSCIYEIVMEISTRHNGQSRHLCQPCHIIVSRNAMTTKPSPSIQILILRCLCETRFLTASSQWLSGFRLNYRVRLLNEPGPLRHLMTRQVDAHSIMIGLRN